jgi:HAD superfamily hydrolase (TIGR01509 family)
MIRALVFDFDGLIFDSETHEYAVVREIFQEHGADLSLEVWGECVGRAAGYFDPCTYLEECTGTRLERGEMDRLRHERFHARIQGQGPLPGVAGCLEAARARGLRLAVASSATRDWVEGQLGRLGLRGHFDCVLTADDVERAKPHPDLYLRAVERLGVRPEEAVAFEDSPNGALAAKTAGLHCVVVPNAVTAALSFCPVDLRVESMLQVEVDALLARLGAGEDDA